MGQLKLTIEVRQPSYAQGKTVRKSIGNKLWDKVREEIYKQNSYTCFICGTKDLSLEAHEVWDYDEENAVMVLKEIKCLCYLCHDIKHLYHSLLRTKDENKKKKLEELKEHFKKVNGCNDKVFKQHGREQKIKAGLARLLLSEEEKILLENEQKRLDELKSKKWTFSVYEAMPFYDEVIQKLDKKGLLWKENDQSINVHANS